MSKQSIIMAALAAGLFAAAGCGGPPQAQPTAIPAGVVRPVQPTPQYPGGADVFLLLTPGAAPQFVPSPAAQAALALAGEDGSQQRAAIRLYIENQTPSAVGIAPGGTAIYAEPGGRALAAVPTGGVLTVTGKSADGAWYSVYNDSAVFGWAPAGQLRVYGGDDLVVVGTAPDPAPIATLLAQAAEPVHVLDDLMAAFDATATATADQPAPVAPKAATPMPTDEPVPAELRPAQAPAAGPEQGALATPTPRSSAGPAPDRAVTVAATAGVVTSEGRLNVRAEPDTAAAIVRKLDPGTAVTIVERNAENTWLRLQLDDGTTGWVAAEFVRSASP